MIAERLAGVGAEAALARTLGDFLRDEDHGAVEADGERIVAVVEIGVGFLMLNIRTEAADIRLDRLAGFRVQANNARQRE